MIDSQSNADFVLCLSRGFLLRAVGLVALLFTIFYAGKVILVIFAAVFLAIVIRAVADQLRRVIPVNARWSYVIVLCTLLALSGGLGYLVGPRVITQAHEIGKTIPQSLGNIRDELNRYDWGRDITGMFSQTARPTQAAGRVTAYASKIAEGITDAVVIVVVALFVGADPSLYRRGFLQLMPERHRERTTNLLNDIAVTVRGWLLAQLIPMAVLGIGTTLGLWAMGIPLAFTLGLFTALMLFVPYIGSITAFIPTVLIALTQGPMKMVYVTLLYLAVHVAEGYVITPIAQRHAVRLPPALTLVAQLFMWTVAGILGLLIATPLAAVGLVIVQKVYLKEQPAQGA